MSSTVASLLDHNLPNGLGTALTAPINLDTTDQPSTLSFIAQDVATALSAYCDAIRAVEERTDHACITRRTA